MTSLLSLSNFAVHRTGLALLAPAGDRGVRRIVGKAGA
jgi:hypothetical protein